MKCFYQKEFVICGYTAPEGEVVGFGALLFGFYRQGRLIYAGKVGTGFDNNLLQDHHAKLNRRRRKTPPFEGRVPRSGESQKNWGTN